MRRKSKTGTLIAIEGGEGSGKTTLMNDLKKVAEGMDDIAFFSNPSKELETTRMIRDLLVNKEHDISHATELMLFMCARKELTEKLIQPALDENKIVFVDRWDLSTWAYQAVGRGIENHHLCQLDDLIDHIHVNFLIVLSLDPKEGVKRSLKRLEEGDISEDKMEMESDDFHTNIFVYMREAGRRNPNGISIDVTGKTPEEVLKEALIFLEEKEVL